MSRQGSLLSRQGSLLSRQGYPLSTHGHLLSGYGHLLSRRGYLLPDRGESFPGRCNLSQRSCGRNQNTYFRANCTILGSGWRQYQVNCGVQRNVGAGFSRRVAPEGPLLSCRSGAAAISGAHLGCHDFQSPDRFFRGAATSGFLFRSPSRPLEWRRFPGDVKTGGSRMTPAAPYPLH